jgi:DNA end-binding protein Ku
MRAIWSGSISFGLVNIPIQLFPGTVHKDIQFHLLHAECHTPVQYKKFCPTHNRELEADEIVKGFEYQRGKYVIVTDEDFAAVDIEMARSIDILDFVKLEEVDPTYYEKSYYLGPNAGAEKAYSLLVESLERSRQVAIARLVVKNKQHLATIRVREGALVLETMFFADEIRRVNEIPGLPVKVKATEKELDLALGLVNSMTSTFNPEKYHDEYREKLMTIIQRKAAGEEVVVPEMAEKEAKVIDLMSALKESIEKIKSGQAAKAGPSRRAQAKVSRERRAKKRKPAPKAVSAKS